MDIIAGLLLREGWPAYSNDPADHGGPTKGGITLRDLEEWRGTSCTAEDVRDLTEEEARAIYSKRYITDWHFDQIPDAWTQEFVVDTGVLQGQHEGAVVLQRALGVPTDGDIGPVTLAALTTALQHNPMWLRKELIRQRMHCLLDDMCSDIPKEQRQTTNLKWRHGWWNRVIDFL